MQVGKAATQPQPTVGDSAAFLLFAVVVLLLQPPPRPSLLHAACRAFLSGRGAAVRQDTHSSRPSCAGGGGCGGGREVGLLYVQLGAALDGHHAAHEEPNEVHGWRPLPDPQQRRAMRPDKLGDRLRTVKGHALKVYLGRAGGAAVEHDGLRRLVVRAGSELQVEYLARGLRRREAGEQRLGRAYDLHWQSGRRRRWRRW